MAHAWRHSDSSSSSSSTSDSGDDGWRPVAPVKPKAVGRPRKYPVGVETKAQRRACLANAATQSAMASSSSTAAGSDSLSLILRPLGGPMPELVGRVMECWSGLSCNTDIGVSVLKVVNAYLGADGDISSKKRPIASMSLDAAARSVDADPRTFRRQVLSMAEAVFAGSRALASSVLSKLLLLHKQRRICISGVFTSIAYDETPLIVRVADKVVAGAAGAVDVVPATTKLLCADFELSILIRDVSTGSYRLSILSLPCPVVALKKGTGELLKHCLKTITRVPLLDEVRAVSDDVLADSVGDGPSSSTASASKLFW